MLPSSRPCRFEIAQAACDANGCMELLLPTTPSSIIVSAPVSRFLHLFDARRQRNGFGGKGDVILERDLAPEVCTVPLASHSVKPSPPRSNSSTQTYR